MPLRILYISFLALIFGEVLSRFILTRPFVRLPGGKLGYATTLNLVGTSSKLEAEGKENRAQQVMVPLRGLVAMTESGLRLIPNREVTVYNDPLSTGPVTLRTNALGFRGPPPLPGCTCPILFLGDSITFGSYLPEEDLYATKVGQSLSANIKLQVFNSSFIGYGLKDEVQLLEDILPQLKPKFIFVQSYLNDVTVSARANLFAPYLLQYSWFLSHLSGSASTIQVLLSSMNAQPGDELKKWYREAALARGFNQADKNLVAKADFNQLIFNEFADWGNAWSDSMWHHMRTDYARLAELAKRHNSKLFIMLSPVKYQVEAAQVEDFPQKKLEKIAQELNLPYLDPLPKLRSSWAETKTALFGDRCHYTAFGHELLASAVVDFLKANDIKSTCAAFIKDCESKAQGASDDRSIRNSNHI